MTPELQSAITLLLGPTGALALALAVIYAQWKQLQKLREQTREAIRALNQCQQCGSNQQSLREVQDARLEDAKATGVRLLELNEKIHKTIDRLEELVKIQRANSLRPPGGPRITG